MNKNRYGHLIKIFYTLSILFAVAVIICLFFLPDIVVVHYGLKGIEYGSKYLDFIIMLVPFILTACFDSFTKKKAFLANDKECQTPNVKRCCWILIITDAIVYLICVAFLWIQFYGDSTWVSNIFNGFTTVLSFIINGYTLSLFVIIIGLLVVHVKPNLFVGIRNFHLIDNQSLWKRVHKISSFIFVITGCISLVLCFFVSDEYRLWIPIAILIIDSVGIQIYTHHVVQGSSKHIMRCSYCNKELELENDNSVLAHYAGQVFIVCSDTCKQNMENLSNIRKRNLKLAIIPFTILVIGIIISFIYSDYVRDVLLVSTSFLCFWLCLLPAPKADHVRSLGYQKAVLFNRIAAIFIVLFLFLLSF